MQVFGDATAFLVMLYAHDYFASQAECDLLSYTAMQHSSSNGSSNSKSVLWMCRQMVAR